MGARIQNGLIETIARYIIFPTGTKDEFILLRQQTWTEYWHPTKDHDFWKNGDVQFGKYDSSDSVSLFGVRFSPDGIKAMLPPSKVPLPVQPPSQTAQVAADRQKQLATVEAENFSRAILAGWPDATEEWARDKALLFFPEHKVPRDWFRDIFRAIRGPRKRGKPAKSAK